MSGQEIATREAFGAPSHTDAPIVPATVAEVEEFVAAIVRSGAIPRSYESLPDAKRSGFMIVAILKGKELGMLPLEALQSIYVVNGMPTIYGDALVSFAMASGMLESYADGFEGEGEHRKAWVEVSRKGLSGKVRREFSVADAARQSLTGKKGPWQHSRDRMLMIRARTYAFRDLFADALKGLGVAEEQIDINNSLGIDAAPANSTRRINVLDDAPAAAASDVVTPAAGDSTGAVAGVADGPQSDATASRPVESFSDAEFEESPLPSREDTPQAREILQQHADAGNQFAQTVLDEFPGDAIARERETKFDAPFAFTITDGKGGERTTNDGEQWCGALVSIFKKADVQTARDTWKRNAAHVAAAESAGHNGLAVTVREAAHMAGDAERK